MFKTGKPVIIIRSLTLLLTLIAHLRTARGAVVDSVDNTCEDDGLIVITHQDVRFTFFHNHTHDFARYQIQTNITFHIDRISASSRTRTSGGSAPFKFHLHGRCPSWGERLNNGSSLFAVSGSSSSSSTNRRIPNLAIKCCSTQKDTMLVQFSLTPGSGDEEELSGNFTLVLAAVEAKTESDLVGVTRIPMAAPKVRNQTGGAGPAMVMTNFHDIFARHSFPLVDSLTSLYSMALTIVVDESPNRHYHHHRNHEHQQDWIVLSNTQLSSTSTKYLRGAAGGSGHRRRVQTWTFDPTPPMCGSYLAFVIGKGFRRNRSFTASRKIEINVWTLPPKNAPSVPNNSAAESESTRFASEMTSILMDYFEQEFAYPYPLSKFDIVEAPLDYEAFVVWGLCFVKPGRLQMQSATTTKTAGTQTLRESIPRKKELSETLAHEIAHQWFGSLVTPRTWNDVFLSESFATFYGVEAIRFARGVPQWMASEAMITALTHRKISLHTDHTIPISSSVMYKNWSRDVQFSTIVYHKGATLLRMLKWVLGEKTFRDGVRAYLHRYEYSNAGAEDFFKVLDRVVRKDKIAGWDDRVLDITAFLKPYIYQPSYPLVNVRINGTHATLTQEPYLQQQHNPSYKWYIPITVHLQSKHMKTYWLKPDDTLRLPVSEFGFMVRMFHLYAIRPIYEGGSSREEDDEDEDVDVLD